MMRCIAALALSTLVLSPSQADSIRVGDESYDDVYVLESDSLVYVLLPESGKTLSFVKDPSLEISLSPNDAERDALKARYQSTRDVARSRSAARFEIETYADAPLDGRNRTQDWEVRDEFTTRAAHASLSYSDRGVPVLRLKGDAKAGPPAMIARTTGGNAGFAGRAGGGPAALAQGGGRAGGGGAVGGAGGGGRAGGGGGRGGAGGGGRGGGVAGFTNISELFGTIDDRSVGETPNAIVQQN